MACATDSSTWSVQKDWDEAKLFFEIPNFSDVRMTMSAGKGVASNTISIGRSSFSVMVYPNGRSESDIGSNGVGVFLDNDSKHSVVVDCTTTFGNTTRTLNDQKIESDSLYGWPNFLNSADARKLTNFVLSMDIKLKKEKIDETSGEAVNKSFISIKEVEGGVEKGMQKKMKAHTAELRGYLAATEGRLEGEMKQAEKRWKRDVEEVKVEISDFTDIVRDSVEDLEGKVDQVKRDLKAEIGKGKTPATDFIPECLVCLESLETLKIVQCMQGHKICEPCSEKEEVVACPSPTCKLAFLGRDMGMEASVQFMIDGSPARCLALHPIRVVINL